MSHVFRIVRDEYIANPSFEGGLGITGWTTYSSPSTFAQSSSQSHSGGYSLNIVTATSIPRGGYTTVNVRPNTSYEVSAWAYITAGSFKLYCNANSSGNVGGSNNDMGAADSTWRKTTATFTTGASDTSVDVYFQSTTAASTGYFDEVRFVEILADFQDVTKYPVRTWSMHNLGTPYSQAQITLDVRSTTAPLFFDALAALTRNLETARRNWEYLQNNQYYTPVWLQFQHVSGSYLMQTECFGLDKDSEGAIENILARPELILSNRIEKLTLNLKVRGYFEETGQQAIATASSVSNSPSTSTLGSNAIRGDLPAPLYLKVRTPTASQDTVIVGARTIGAQSDVTSFSALLEFEGFTTFGSGVANLSDANLSPGSGTSAKRWTVGGTTEQLLGRKTFTLSNSNMGKFRVFVRCRDNAAAANVKIRVRAGLTDSSNFIYGDYGDNAKYVTKVAGTTEISLIDCGVITVPPFDVGPNLATTGLIELRGQADSSAGSPTFDVDCLYLMPCYEDAMGGGYCAVTYPVVMGTGAAPDGVLDARDRTPDAYMDSSGVILFVASNLKAPPLFAQPNQQVLLYVLTYDSSTGRHTYNANNTISVVAQPRYRLARGS